jgi:hypothetical protein
VQRSRPRKEASTSGSAPPRGKQHLRSVARYWAGDVDGELGGGEGGRCDNGPAQEIDCWALLPRRVRRCQQAGFHTDLTIRADPSGRLARALDPLTPQPCPLAVLHRTIAVETWACTLTASRLALPHDQRPAPRAHGLRPLVGVVSAHGRWRPAATAAARAAPPRSRLRSTIAITIRRTTRPRTSGCCVNPATPGPAWGHARSTARADRERHKIGEPAVHRR